MKLKIPIRKIAYDLCEYSLAFMLVLNCRSVWMTLPSMGWFATIVMVLLCVSAVGCIACKRKIKRYAAKRGIILLLGAGAYIAVFLVVNSYNRSGFMRFGIVVCVLLLFYCICCEPTDEIPSVMKKYENIILLIAGISLVMWVLCSVLKLISRTNVVYSTWTGGIDLVTFSSYYGIYFETSYISNFLGLGRFARNTAIFSEAPMASFHFSLAFLLELLQKKDVKWWKVVLLGAAVLSTVSTTGYVVVIAGLGVKYFCAKGKDKFLQIARVFVVPVALIIGGGLIYTLVADKLATVGSGMVRIDDFAAGYKAWMTNPIFGSGFANGDYIVNFMSAFRKNNTGFSNSVMTVLANGGIYLSMPYFTAFFLRIQKTVQKKNLQQTAFALGILFMVAITLVTYQYITVFLLVWFALGKVKSE